jgi:hypothetical protein
MEMKADTTHVLMSDVLRGNVPELEDVASSHDETKRVLVVFDKVVSGREEGLVGILRGVLFDASPEVECRVPLEEAFAVVQAQGLSFQRFTLHNGEDVIEVPGPFLVAAARIDDIDNPNGTCTLSLHLKRPAR